VTQKVRYAYDYPCAWALGVMMYCRGGVLRPIDVGADLHARRGGHYLRELSPLVLLMDCPVGRPRRSWVRRHAPGLDGYCPGSNAAGQPHRWGELCV